MARLLVLSFSPIGSDPRVMRQLRALSGEHELTVAGHAPAPPAVDAEFIELQTPPRSRAGRIGLALRLLARRYEAQYWSQAPVRQALAALRGRRFDLVLANDIAALPLALRIAAGAPVLFDAHEYSPREFEDSLRWRVFRRGYVEHLCRSYLPAVSGSMTVCEGIAQAWSAHYGLHPEVVYNSPAKQDLPLRPPQPGRIRLVHHGIALRARRIERTLALMDLLDERFTLDLMLVGFDPVYLEELRRRAAGNPRIRLRDPVPMERIAEAINDYDLGVFLLPPVNFNYRHALPNKFFEFIQARLGVAIGPSPEMRSLVERWDLGVVAEDFEPASLAARLRALREGDLLRFKRNAERAAQVLNSDQVSLQLRAAVAGALR